MPESVFICDVGSLQNELPESLFTAAPLPGQLCS